MKGFSRQPLRLLAFLLAMLLALPMSTELIPAPVAAASSSELKEQLEDLQEQYDQMEKEKQELQDRIHDNMDEMERLVTQKDILDQEIFLLHSQLQNLEDQITTYNLLIADKQDALDTAQARLDTLTEQNRQRIRAMEMYGRMNYWSVLAQAGTFGELLDRLSMVAEIAQADQRRLRDMREAARTVADAHNQLETEKQGLEASRKILGQAQQTLQEKKAEADGLLQQLYAKGQAYEQWLREKEEEADQLSDQIAQTEKDYTEAKRQEYLAWLATSVPSTSSGKNDPPSNVVNGITWVMPIRYKRFSSPYGMRDHPIDGVPKFHHGVDLAAPEGTTICASRSGVVTVATYSSSAGYYVTINHGDGFSTTYMHMTHYIVKVGQRVEAGQKIGECGNTGASKGNHLHFGIYYNGKSVNPANYINFY